MECRGYSTAHREWDTHMMQKVEILGTKGAISLGSVKGNDVVLCSSGSKKGSYPLVESWRTLFKDAYLKEDRAFIDCICRIKNPPLPAWTEKWQ